MAQTLVESMGVCTNSAFSFTCRPCYSKLQKKDKTHEWQLNDQEQMVIADMDAIYKVWEEDGRFSGFSMTEKEANKAHRDWQFILQEQDAKALLAHACEQFLMNYIIRYFCISKALRTKS